MVECEVSVLDIRQLNPLFVCAEVCHQLAVAYYSFHAEVSVWNNVSIS